MRFLLAITPLSNMKKLSLILLPLVAFVSNGRCDAVIADFVECIHEITSNNLGVLDENIKGNVDKLKNSYVSETKEHIDLLLAQFVDAYGDVQEDLVDLAKQTVLNVTASMDADLKLDGKDKDFGVDANLVVNAEGIGAAEIAAGIGDDRRGLVLNFKASLRNMVHKVMNEPLVKTPKVFEKFLGVLNKNQTFTVNVAPPKKSRPLIDHLPVKFHGYAKLQTGSPVIVVDEILDNHENCYADYVSDFQESIHDMLSEDVNVYVNAYGHLAKMQDKINIYKNTVLSELKMFTDECVEKLKKCEDIVAALKAISENILNGAEELIKEAAEKY